MNQFVTHCRPGLAKTVWNPSPLEVIANRPNTSILQENLSRLRFFRNGSYSYKPSESYVAAYNKYKSASLFK